MAKSFQMFINTLVNNLTAVNIIYTSNNEIFLMEDKGYIINNKGCWKINVFSFYGSYAVNYRLYFEAGSGLPSHKDHQQNSRKTVQLFIL